MNPKREGKPMQAAAEYRGIEERVTCFIQGKHGRIGIIVPDTPPTEQEWIDLHRAIAEILVRNALNNNAATKE
jgi:hypothetical protein